MTLREARTIAADRARTRFADVSLAEAPRDNSDPTERAAVEAAALSSMLDADPDDEEIELDPEDENDDLYGEGWSQPAYHEGRLRVMAEKCSSCIFRPGNLMDLNKGRVAGMLETVRRQDSYVNCHKTLGTGQPGAVCKGSDEAHHSQVARIAERLGIIQEITEAEILAEAARYEERNA